VGGDQDGVVHLQQQHGVRILMYVDTKPCNRGSASERGGLVVWHGVLNQGADPTGRGRDVAKGFP